MNNLEKEFTLHQEAFELKDLGFDEECLGYYNIDPHFKNPSFRIGTPFDHQWCLPTPTYSQAFRWFRHEYALESYIRANLCVDVPKTYQFNIDDNIDDVWYDTYEEAELACLKKLIEIVKGGNK
jgi:hypothetical protein